MLLLVATQRASIVFHGSLDICSDLPPTTPLPPVQSRDAQHKFVQHKRAHTDHRRPDSTPLKSLDSLPSQRNRNSRCSGSTVPARGGPSARERQISPKFFWPKFVFLAEVLLNTPEVMDVRTFRSRMCAPKSLLCHS